tara:strand:+ start:469 stop:978 length:510 start_codon:yes stop_codon:yes gene_type:complete
LNWIKLSPLFLFCILSFFLYWKVTHIEESEQLSSALIDKNFPKLDLEIIEGNSSFIDLLGKETFVLNYFASWCAPCRTEHKVLEAFKKDYIIVGIGYKDTENNIKNFLSELGNPFRTVMLDSNGRAAIELGLYGVPETYFIGKDGKIKYKHVGPITKDKFNKIISLVNK